MSDEELVTFMPDEPVEELLVLPEHVTETCPLPDVDTDTLGGQLLAEGDELRVGIGVLAGLGAIGLGSGVINTGVMAPVDAASLGS